MGYAVRIQHLPKQLIVSWKRKGTDLMQLADAQTQIAEGPGDENDENTL